MIESALFSICSCVCAADAFTGLEEGCTMMQVRRLVIVSKDTITSHVVKGNLPDRKVYCLGVDCAELF